MSCEEQGRGALKSKTHKSGVDEWALLGCDSARTSPGCTKRELGVDHYRGLDSPSLLDKVSVRAREPREPVDHGAIFLEVARRIND
jgi:hypothetical protein